VVRGLPNAILWIVGSDDPSYEARLKAEAAALGAAGSIRFQGSVPSESSHQVYQAADVFAFPTLCSEGMSLSLLEAMASGLPCVVAEHASATASHSARDVLFVGMPNLDGAFVEPIVDLLKRPERREYLGAAARHAICGKYSEELALGRIRSCFCKELAFVNGTGQCAEPDIL
jgi:phosphatidyl-myo-inositol dimannoside synthase